MSKKSLVVMGLAALCGAGLLWAAGPQEGGPRPSRDGRFKQELGLTDAQVKQLEQLRVDERKAEIRRRADRELLRIELMELLKADQVDEKAVRAKAKQMADLEAQKVQAKAERGLALRRIVSAEQAEKLMRWHRRQQRGAAGAGWRRGGPEGRRGGPEGRRGPAGPQAGPRQPGGPAVGDGDVPGEGWDLDAPGSAFADEPQQR